MQDDAAAKRSLSVWFFGICFAEIAMASFEKVHEMLCLCLIEEIIDEEEFVLLYEAHRPSNLPFPHSANSNEKVSSRIKTQPKVKPISEGKRGIFLCLFVWTLS